MPRCIKSTSPDDRSAKRYFARRPSPVTFCPFSRATKSFGNGQRRSPRCATTSSKRASSIAGASPRRTVSTSGSSGILGPLSFLFLHRLREPDAVAERIGHRDLQHAPFHPFEAGTVVTVVLADQLAVQL